MPYTYTNSRGETYYLHYLEREHDDTGTPYVIYYFTKEPGDNTAEALPDEYTITESDGGLPLLEKTA
ncbi:MAG: hypothetical protein U5L04_13435 [Trueperaceae bacterium]|nr:hypothetical protein [Trueperaceae bacterium]